MNSEQVKKLKDYLDGVIKRHQKDYQHYIEQGDSVQAFRCSEIATHVMNVQIKINRLEAGLD